MQRHFDCSYRCDLDSLVAPMHEMETTLDKVVTKLPVDFHEHHDVKDFHMHAAKEIITGKRYRGVNSFAEWCYFLTLSLFYQAIKHSKVASPRDKTAQLSEESRVDHHHHASTHQQLTAGSRKPIKGNHKNAELLYGNGSYQFVGKNSVNDDIQGNLTCEITTPSRMLDLIHGNEGSAMHQIVGGIEVRLTCLHLKNACPLNGISFLFPFLRLSSKF